VTAPGPDWVEQARRFAAGLAAARTGTGHTGAGHIAAGLSDVLGNLLGSTAGEDGTGHGSDCRWCPLCAGLAALRGRRPELLEALADVLAGAATALRTSARTPHDDEAATDHPAPEPTAPPEETVPHPAATPAVQRIDVA
jgi:hypothetical protein